MLSSNGGTESNAAMSLWQRFAELQNKADALRTERRGIEYETERLTGQIRQLKIDMESEMKQLHQSKKNEYMKENIRQALDVVQEEHSVALKTRNDADLALEQWMSRKQEETERALAFDRSFRIHCEQWKLRATAIGLDDAMDEAAIFSKDPANAETVREELTFEPPHNTERDPLLWKIPEEDEELQFAVDRYRATISLRLDVQKLVDESNADLCAIVSKQLAADQRSVDLRSRLKVVLSETKHVQSSIDEVEELILHEEALAAAYRKKIEERYYLRGKSRIENPTTRSVVELTNRSALSTQQSPDRAGGIGKIMNPYAQKSVSRRVTITTPQNPSTIPTTLSHVALTTSRPKTMVREDVMDAVLGTRRRRDRQFGCSVSVGIQSVVQPSLYPQGSVLLEDEDSDDDDLFLSPGFTKKHKHSVPNDDDS